MPVKSKKNKFGVNAKDVVDGVFNDLGHERISYGHWTHSLFRWYYLMRFFSNTMS
jgi:hypothetical protein